MPLKLFVSISLLLFTLLLFGISKAQAVYVRAEQGNLYVVYSDSIEKQLTFTRNDEMPALSPSGKTVVFVRKSGRADVQKIAFLKVNIETMVETVIAEITGTVIADPITGGQRLKNIYFPRFLGTNSYVYFLKDEYYNATELDRLNIDTGKLERLCSAGSFELITKGIYARSLFVSYWEIYRCTLIAQYKLIKAGGRIIKKFKSSEEAYAFLKNHQR